MKTERVTILTSPEFKEFLGAEALREGVSVGELVRKRCLGRVKNDDDEELLLDLAIELKKAVKEARVALKAGLSEANEVLAAMRADKNLGRKSK